MGAGSCAGVDGRGRQRFANSRGTAAGSLRAIPGAALSLGILPSALRAQSSGAPRFASRLHQFTRALASLFPVTRCLQLSF